MNKYEQASEKVQEELSMYKENLLLQSSEEIYRHSLETAIKEEAAETFSQIIYDLSDEQLDSIINTESFLDEAFKTFCSNSVELNDMCSVIQETAEYLTYEANKKDIYQGR